MKKRTTEMQRRGPGNDWESEKGTQGMTGPASEYGGWPGGWVYKEWLGEWAWRYREC